MWLGQGREILFSKTDLVLQETTANNLVNFQKGKIHQLKGPKK